MELKEFLKTWEGTQAENRWNRLAIVGLIGLAGLLSVKVMTKDAVVVLQPVTLSEEAWVTKAQASQSYLESWGLFLAQLVGNVTPATVDFLKDRLGPLLAPAIYADVIEAVEVQANQIRNDRVSMRFEPRAIEYELSTNKVFVYGNSFVKGVNGTEERNERTYEFEISISQYQPTVHYMTTYAGRPRTERIVQQHERREEMRIEREERQQNR